LPTERITVNSFLKKELFRKVLCTSVMALVQAVINTRCRLEFNSPYSCGNGKQIKNIGYHYS
jgi:hypothetical protein